MYIIKDPLAEERKLIDLLLAGRLAEAKLLVELQTIRDHAATKAQIEKELEKIYLTNK